MPFDAAMFFFGSGHGNKLSSAKIKKEAAGNRQLLFSSESKTI